MSTTASQRMLQALPEALKPSQYVVRIEREKNRGSFRGLFRGAGSYARLYRHLDNHVSDSPNAVDRRWIDSALADVSLVGNAF